MKSVKRRLSVATLAATLAVVGLLLNQGDASASVSSQVQLLVKATQIEAVGLVTVEAPLVVQSLLNLADGVGASQADMIYSDSRTLSASSAEDLDLAGGGLLDPLGGAFEPAKIRVLMVTASASNTNDVVVGNKAAQILYLDSVTSEVVVQPGGVFVLTAPATAGITVTATTADLITVTNSAGGTSVDYEIVILGTSS